MKSSRSAGSVDVETALQELKVSVRTATDPVSTPDKVDNVKPKVENQKAAPEDSKGQNEAKAGKLSGAELKKKAKEEKAAKRAKEKQNQQVSPAAEASRDSKPEALKHILKSSAPLTKDGVTSKQQHKKTGSIIANPPNSVSLRQVETKTASAPPQISNENKHVALFGHLYGSPRRTTIAGAGKDVHPAVLALGLQMSNYVVCGSNARCVATLLVFKRVSNCPDGLGLILSKV
jgi:translation initiation factor eIF-2B subunit delta